MYTQTKHLPQHPPFNLIYLKQKCRLFFFLRKKGGAPYAIAQKQHTHKQTRTPERNNHVRNNPEREKERGLLSFLFLSQSWRRIKHDALYNQHNKQKLHDIFSLSPSTRMHTQQQQKRMYCMRAESLPSCEKKSGSPLFFSLSPITCGNVALK